MVVFAGPWVSERVAKADVGVSLTKTQNYRSWFVPTEVSGVAVTPVISEQAASPKSTSLVPWPEGDWSSSV